MADKMTYQQARRIRNKDYSLKNLITRNIRSKDMGAGQAIKAAFKEKFDVGTRLKAKVTGIKEKFDPLNIAKFLTFGSNVAPALLGKLTGRSKADIRNFTGGRQSYEDFGPQTATKIGKDPSDSGDMSGVSDILNKILELQQRTYDNIREQRERLNNFKEEKDLEADKRHKDLLNAIKGFSPGQKQTAEKVNSGGGLDIMGIIESMLGAFGGVTQMIKLIGGLVASPLGLALIAGAGIGLAIYELWKASSPEAVKESLRGEGAAGVTAAGLGSEGQMTAPTVDEEARKKMASAVDKKGLKASTIEELQAKKAEILDVGVDPRIKQKNGMTLDKVDKERLTQINAIDAEIATKQKSASPATGSTASPATPATTSPTGSTASPAAASDSTAAAMTTTPPSQQLNAVTAENRSAKMDSMVNSSSTVTNNVVANNTPKPKAPKPSIPPVRNMEATLQRMIYNSTRVV
jgi:hypothetical protein